MLHTARAMVAHDACVRPQPVILAVCSLKDHVAHAFATASAFEGSFCVRAFEKSFCVHQHPQFMPVDRLDEPRPCAGARNA